jgi:predicted site-specific integrase-resolvase
MWVKLYSISEFAGKLGVCANTLRAWDKEGKLVALRTPTNKRRYTEEMLYRAMGIRNRQEPQKVILYARVSSVGQKGDLENQLKYLRDFSAGRGLPVDEVLSDVGSALNYKRKNFLKICSMVTRGEIKTVVVAHKDRLVRFGFDFFEDLFAKFGCGIVIVNKAEDMSPERELSEDLISIVQHFAARLYGQRTYKARRLAKTVKEVLSGSAADSAGEEPATEQEQVG